MLLVFHTTKGLIPNTSKPAHDWHELTAYQFVPLVFELLLKEETMMTRSFVVRTCEQRRILAQAANDGMRDEERQPASGRTAADLQRNKDYPPLPAAGPDFFFGREIGGFCGGGAITRGCAGTRSRFSPRSSLSASVSIRWLRSTESRGSAAAALAAMIPKLIPSRTDRRLASILRYPLKRQNRAAARPADLCSSAAERWTSALRRARWW